MKRAIKFRGRLISDGRWIEGDLRQMPDGPCVIYLTDRNHGEAVDPQTVGQFTGICEAGTFNADYPDEYAGKPVYEGDIVMPEGDYSAEPRVVVFYECMFGLATAKEYDHLKNGAHPYLNDYAHLPTLGDYPMQGPLKVIGNVYDNPELLEGGLR